MDRHAEQAQRAYSEAGSQKQRQAEQTAWNQTYRDAVWRGFAGGCLTGLYRMATLKRRLR